MRKLCETLRQAMEQAGLRDGMTISFHHHLRNGDYVLNMVLDEAAKMGVKDLTVNASSVFDCYEPMPGLIPEDEPIVAEAQAMIEAAIAKL